MKLADQGDGKKGSVTYNLFQDTCANDNMKLLLDLINLGPTLNQINSKVHNKYLCNIGLIMYEKLT